MFKIEIRLPGNCDRLQIILEKAVESTTSDYCTESTGLLSEFSPHRIGDTISAKIQREVP